MKHILVIHTGEGDETDNYRFMEHDLRLRRVGCGGDAERARGLITAGDGQVPNYSGGTITLGSGSLLTVASGAKLNMSGTVGITGAGAGAMYSRFLIAFSGTVIGRRQVPQSTLRPANSSSTS